MENQFQIGDLVWAKADRHSWWPGLIYHEALSTLHARQAKKEGHVLVSFFGDNSYRWLNPKKLFSSSSRFFVKAINEAVYEVIHRAAIGMTCPCVFFASYRPSCVESFLEVDLDGYQSRGVYTVQQIEGFRQEFRPAETLAFIQQLALDPSIMAEDINSSKEVAKVLGFRKARYAEVDEPYFVAFGVNPIPTRAGDGVVASDNQEIALLQEDPSEAEIPGQKKPKVKDQSKTKRRLKNKVKRRVKRYGRHDSNTITSHDHVPQKKRQPKFELKKRVFTSASEDEIQSSPCPSKEPSISNAESDLQQEETTFTPPHDPVTSCSASVCGIQCLSDEIHARYWQQKGETRVKVNQGSIDIFEKVLYLLNKDRQIVLE
ncbi:PWWP-like protein [Cynara cardunculus var. scolymus]|uniref:PWWP-like protein n=1 Tax=Cynara cardunculus var. scolymus TaxID=59895 RepID=A0A118JS70_CYNCS|nr:PWWP-like protein [Cynara cardunculus var. scolymus]